MISGDHQCPISFQAAPALAAGGGSAGGAAVAAQALRRAGLTVAAHQLDNAATTAFMDSLARGCLIAPPLAQCPPGGSRAGSPLAGAQ